MSLDGTAILLYIRINHINHINMFKDRVFTQISEFMRYLAAHPEAETGLPSMPDLGQKLGLGLPTVREQVQVAKAFGLVDVRPRIGTRRRPYTFAPAASLSLTYAVALSDTYFGQFSELRNHLETAFWDEAACKLTDRDKSELQELIRGARQKLSSSPVQVPHEEHRALHLLIFSRLDNAFVTGILEAYWEMYETVGLNLYSGDMNYLNEVWDYHSQMVDAICSGDFEAGRRALMEHVDLLAQRPA
jgi:DNA-binding FadR family transcriptional regulator